MQTETATNTALMLPGGGARGSYQVGVLKAIGELLGPRSNPFPVICGTSAGAINAAVMASHAHEYLYGIQRLEEFWRTMRCPRIYRTDAWTVLSSALRWFVTMFSGGLIACAPKALLDNRPLENFLRRTLRLEGIQAALEQGHLRGVAVTAAGYSCASAISFYQAQGDILPWDRPRRRGQPTRLQVEHLLASAALPVLFPAQRIGHEYFGDGGMRLTAPLSPAIHLGAKRILIIGTRDENPDLPPTQPAAYPKLGEIGGYLLDTIFMDTLNADLARMRRVNRTLKLIPEAQRDQTSLVNIDSLVIRPSKDLRYVTRDHVRTIPRSVQLLLRSLGGWGKDWRMASYLLFESGYCGTLIDLGYADGMAAEDDIRQFFAEG